MILDTNAVSALFQGDSDLMRTLPTTEKHHLPVTVLGEYRFGITGSRRRRELEDLLQRLEEESYILYPDRDTARYYAELRHQLKEAGTPVPENDIWIAALARQHGLAIVTRDQYFDFVVGVEKVSW